MARLTADDWTEAALDALLTDGPDEVAIQPLARRLNATKGSFYWHFETRDDLLRAALERWQESTTTQLVADVEAASDDPLERAALFLRGLVEQGEARPGELRLLAAGDHADVRAAVEAIAGQRIDYLSRTLRAGGWGRPVAQRRATLAYAAYLGYAQLADVAPGLLPSGTRARRGQIDELCDQLFNG